MLRRCMSFVLCVLFVVPIGSVARRAESGAAWKLWTIGAFRSEAYGLVPIGALLGDAHGALYGVTQDGGSNPSGACDGGCGTVYTIAPSGIANSTWTRRVIYVFKGALPVGTDGQEPLAGVIADAGGALYGTTSQGGNNTPNGEGGVVYKLTPPSPGSTRWRESVLYAFSGKDGLFPSAALVMDASGALYGTTVAGGAYDNMGNNVGYGTVFQLTPPPAGKTSWTETVLYSFSGGADGNQPRGSLIRDAQGALYGTTSGVGGGGNVFKLTPPPAGSTTWTESVLYAFANSSNGSAPQSNLIADMRGDLYGTTAYGGAYGNGVVFELVPPSGGGAPWSEIVLHSFAGGTDGAIPLTGLVADNRGRLYGTAQQGGNPSCVVNPKGCGAVYQLTPPRGGSGWTETVLHAFTSGTDGYYPNAVAWYAKAAGPARASATGTAGALYGTTCCGGNANSAGIVFKLFE